MAHAIGIDLGGTFIKAALVDAETGEMIRQATRPTCDGECDERGVPVFVGGVRGCIEELETGGGEGGVGIGLSAPGLADREGRCIQWMPGRMQGLEGLMWGEVLGRRVAVLNDAHAALLGECWVGAGRGCEDVIMLTLGTGVGGAILSGGRLLKGAHGRAGHLGHVALDMNAERDVYNTPGSLEQAIGNGTIQRRTHGRFESTHALVAAVREGDAAALVWWRESVRALGVAIGSLINVLDPERVIVGGGIASGAGEVLLESLRELVAVSEWQINGVGVPVVAAEAGEWAGAIGAAAAVLAEA